LPSLSARAPCQVLLGLAIPELKSNSNPLYNTDI
jgi:hypothetical protein